MNKHIPLTTAGELPALWRLRAAELRRFGADAQATTAEALAEELTVALSLQDDEALNLTDAARESGYNVDSLGKLVRDGKIPNAGRRGAPRILRRDLPHKVPSSSHPHDDSQLSRSQVAEAVITRFDTRGER